MSTTIVVGNPKPRSRTYDAARALCAGITGSAPDHEVDVIELGAGLLGWGDPAVADAVRTVAASELVIVASPTFKASYTGLLKLFLDQFDTGTGLRGVVAVPLMLGGGPGHQLAPELLLKPVLVELGAVVPCQGLYLLDQSASEPERHAAWLDAWGDAVRGAMERTTR
jgi:FMN reductase